MEWSWPPSLVRLGNFVAACIVGPVNRDFDNGSCPTGKCSSGRAATGKFSDAGRAGFFRWIDSVAPQSPLAPVFPWGVSCGGSQESSSMAQSRD